jgi:hypothetical protein
MEPLRIDGESVIGMTIQTVALGPGTIYAWEPAGAWKREEDAYWVQFGSLPEDAPWEEKRKHQRLLSETLIRRALLID